MSLQLELQPVRSISTFDTNTDSDTYTDSLSTTHYWDQEAVCRNQWYSS